jgi:hypothetical protein
MLIADNCLTIDMNIGTMPGSNEEQVLFPVNAGQKLHSEVKSSSPQAVLAVVDRACH